MKAVRTPDERFASLPDYDFEPHYVEISDGLRVHYVDEGPADGPVVVLLHGFPQFNTSWNAVIARLTAEGYRCVAPNQRGYSPGARPRRPARWPAAGSAARPDGRPASASRGRRGTRS